MGKRLVLIVTVALISLFWLSTSPMAAQVSGYLAEKLSLLTDLLETLLGQLF